MLDRSSDNSSPENTGEPFTNCDTSLERNQIAPYRRSKRTPRSVRSTPSREPANLRGVPTLVNGGSPRAAPRASAFGLRRRCTGKLVPGAPSLAHSRGLRATEEMARGSWCPGLPRLRIRATEEISWRGVFIRTGFQTGHRHRRQRQTDHRHPRARRTDLQTDHHHPPERRTDLQTGHRLRDAAGGHAEWVVRHRIGGGGRRVGWAGSSSSSSSSSGGGNCRWRSSIHLDMQFGELGRNLAETLQEPRTGGEIHSIRQRIRQAKIE
jgi:hypothetical protein